MKGISNIHVTVSLLGTSAAACWNEGDARFHVWFDPKTRAPSVAGGRTLIYKNPLCERGQPGFFDTRKLRAESPRNQAILEHVFETINRDGLVAAAYCAAELAAAEEKRQLEAKAQAERRDEFRRLLAHQWEHDREELLDALSETLCMDDLDALQARLP